jgi:hypothetical protein
VERPGKTAAWAAHPVVTSCVPEKDVAQQGKALPPLRDIRLSSDSSVTQNTATHGAYPSPRGSIRSLPGEDEQSFRAAPLTRLIPAQFRWPPHGSSLRSAPASPPAQSVNRYSLAPPDLLTALSRSRQKNRSESVSGARIAPRPSRWRSQASAGGFTPRSHSTRKSFCLNGL